jgi:hypothetical protein
MRRSAPQSLREHRRGEASERPCPKVCLHGYIDECEGTMNTTEQLGWGDVMGGLTSVHQQGGQH